jgi:hypothetical protein
MHPNQRVKEYDGRLQFRDGPGQTLLIAGQVEAQDGRGDDMQVEAVKIEATMPAERLDARPNLRQGIFGKVDERRSG